MLAPLVAVLLLSASASSQDVAIVDYTLKFVSLTQRGVSLCSTSGCDIYLQVCLAKSRDDVFQVPPRCNVRSPQELPGSGVLRGRSIQGPLSVTFQFQETLPKELFFSVDIYEGSFFGDYHLGGALGNLQNGTKATREHAYQSDILKQAFNITVSCLPGYYGQHCEVKCVPTNTSTCTDTGDIQCRTGWTGTSCTECALGFICSDEMTSVCPAGHFVSQGSQGALCEPCPPGNFQDEPGQERCKPCQIGSAQSREGQKVCEPCRSGQFQSDIGQDLCRPVTTCDTNMFEVVKPSTTNDRVCKECSVCPQEHAKISNCSFTQDTVCQGCDCGENEYLVSCQSSVECEPCTECERGVSFESEPCVGQDRVCDKCSPKCDLGTEFETTPCTETSDRACQQITQCVAGQQETAPATQTSDRQCEPCENGFFNPNGRAECKPHSDCDVGAFVQTEPSLSSNRQCEACGPGNFQDEINMAECKPCPEGQFQPLPRQSTCMLCPIGTVAAKVGAKGCSSCSSTEYQDEAGQIVCKRCNPSCGSCTGPSDSDCSSCPQRSVLRDGKCLSECPTGEVARAGVCRACQPCETSEYISSACTGTTDTVCTECSTCNIFASECNSTHDAVCQAAAQSSRSTSLSPPLLGGAAAGGLILIALVALLVAMLWKKRKGRAKPEQTSEPQMYNNPSFMMSAPDNGVAQQQYETLHFQPGKTTLAPAEEHYSSLTHSQRTSLALDQQDYAVLDVNAKKQIPSEETYHSLGATPEQPDYATLSPISNGTSGVNMKANPAYASSGAGMQENPAYESLPGTAA